MATPLRKCRRHVIAADGQLYRSARGAYRIERAFRRAMVRLVSLMQAGASPAEVAQFILRQQLGVMVGLSHEIENASVDGTFAAAVFEIISETY